MIALCAGGAQAQTTAGEVPLAQPLGGHSLHSPAASVIGQASLVRSPLSTTAVDNQPRFTLVPSVKLDYDTNVLRYANLGGGARDNIRATPGVDLVYRRQFGRVALGVSGSAGYDFNSRFRFLNQSRVHVDGLARAPVGAICAARGQVKFDQRRFDLGDTQSTAGTTSREQLYDVTARCERAAGFSPVAEVSYHSLDSAGRGDLSYFDYHQYVEQLGVDYAKPSLGTLTLSGAAAQLRRPNLPALVGFNDDTDVYSLSLTLNRAVSPRLQFNVGGGVTKADPRRAGVTSFLGGSYVGLITWRPVPRFSVSGSALREVTNQNGVSATYVIREDYRAAIGWNATAKTNIEFAAEHIFRDFRGEGLSPALLPIRADRTNIVSASVKHDLLRKLRISFGVSHRWRMADNTLYNYSSTVVSSSLGARF